MIYTINMVFYSYGNGYGYVNTFYNSIIYI